MPPDKISHYNIVKELGKGSMGVVYDAQPEEGGAHVAIKVFLPDTHLTPDETKVLLDRFEREGSALAQLHHRNLVHVFEAGSEGTTEFIVMEKLEGYNLKDLLTLGTRFTLAETFDIMLQLLEGLQVCHRAGVIHRDVKPANLVRAPDGVIKLTDFGIARIVTDQTLSRTGTVVGTPNYMSPEQIRGSEVDARTDIFSAGVLMYELLTDKKPFDGPDVTAIMYNVTNVHPPSPRFYNSALPEEIDTIVYRALAKQPGDRYISAQEFAQAIRKLESDLHYREGTEAILSALPAKPDPDALDISGGLTAAQVVQSRTRATVPAGADASSIPFIGGIQSGTVYCIDCGMANSADHEFCVRCMRPLLKRDQIFKMAQAQVRVMRGLNRGDYVFLSCLSIIMVGVVLLILYLFFHGGK